MSEHITTGKGFAEIALENRKTKRTFLDDISKIIDRRPDEVGGSVRRVHGVPPVWVHEGPRRPGAIGGPCPRTGAGAGRGDLRATAPVRVTLLGAVAATTRAPETRRASHLAWGVSSDGPARPARDASTGPWPACGVIPRGAPPTRLRAFGPL